MIELVWDQRRTGTATTARGRELAVGEGTDFSPDELLSISAAACLMSHSIRLAAEAGVELLSFTATARLESTEHPPTTRIHLRAQLVTSDVVPEARTISLWRLALCDSPVARVLGDRLVADVQVTRLAISPLEET